MTIKLLGAILVFTGCGGCGFAMAASHRREENALRQYLIALEFMECDLSCRLTPLPELCANAARVTTGCVQALLQNLAQELESQVSPDAECCMRAAIAATSGLPDRLAELLTELGASLGRFDLPGQLKGLASAQSQGKLALDALMENRDNRLRSYQTLGLCAGAALAILFL